MHNCTAIQRAALHAFVPVQDVSGGRPVEVQGTDGRVYGMEIDLELVRAVCTGFYGAKNTGCWQLSCGDACCSAPLG